MSGGPSRPGRQLSLPLAHRAAMSRADLVVGAANAEAVALLDRWPDWPEEGAVIAGPPGSGKSHIASVWRGASGGDAVAAVDIGADTAALLAPGGALAVEDLHAGPLDEAAVFHLLNLARERKARLLFTSRIPAYMLPVRLPDLASRLRAARAITIAEPDDALLRKVLVKLFADRQVAVEPAVIDFLVLRMERSLAAASAVVARLDEEALAAGRAITRQFAGPVIERIYPDQADFWPEEE